MKKVFLIYPSGSKYLVGFCTDLTKFFQNYMKDRSSIDNIAQLNEFVITYRVNKENMSMYAVTIINNETCFMKNV